MTWTEQTKRAYRKMKAAGFKRGEFRARVERRVYFEQGRRCTEYGETRITIFKNERAVMAIPDLLGAGLNVKAYCFLGDGYVHVQIKESYSSEVGKLDVTVFD